MNKEVLNIAVKNCKEETKQALQTVFNALNNGQQKKLLKNENIKSLFDRYQVDY